MNIKTRTFGNNWKKFLKIKILAVFIMIALLCFMIFFSSCSTSPTTPTTTEQTSSTSASTIQNSDLKDENVEISSIINVILPSVVNLFVTFTQPNSSGSNQGVGSGIIYSQDGYIVTNNHVAGGTSQIIVTLSDGSNLEAELIGGDATTDIAVIKIDKTDLVAAQFESIDNQEVGDFVLAVGSPFGIQESITHGIISGKNRAVPISANTLPYVDLVQTDAPINPGNSGGPLINADAKVIGMNTVGLSTSGSSAGINFAIPSDIITNIADQIIKTGKAQIPYIGVEIGQNNTMVQGVMVASVVTGSPAEKAGIKAGDLITGFNDEKIINPYDLLGAVIRSNVGDNVSLSYIRNGATNSVNIQLELRPVNLDLNSV